MHLSWYCVCVGYAYMYRRANAAIDDKYAPHRYAETNASLFNVIKKDLQCDKEACGKFMTLFRMNPAKAPHGYMEACRVLAHIFKDKSKHVQDLGKGILHRSMHRICHRPLPAPEPLTAPSAASFVALATRYVPNQLCRCKHHKL